jgi:ferredoxin-type protein NapH
MSIKTFQKIRITVVSLSMILFPVTFYYLSPFISLRAGAAGIISGSVVMFLVLLVTGTFFGRSFCSWLCPAGCIQEQTAKVRTAKVSVKKIAWVKFVVWGGWLAMLLFFLFRSGGIKAVEFGFGTKMGMSTTSLPSLIAFSIVVLIFFLFSLIIGRRAACHTLCWIAPFMIIGGKLGYALKLPGLHLSSHSERCVDCGRCTAACPMSLNVEQLVKGGTITDSNCILCGGCIETCKKDVIGWSWRRTA